MELMLVLILIDTKQIATVEGPIRKCDDDRWNKNLLDLEGKNSFRTFFRLDFALRWRHEFRRREWIVIIRNTSTVLYTK